MDGAAAWASAVNVQRYTMTKKKKKQFGNDSTDFTIVGTGANPGS